MKIKKFLSILLCVMLTITMLQLDVLAGRSSTAPSRSSASITGSGAAGAPNGQFPASTNGGAIEFDNPFGDVEPGDWFFDDVGFVYINGLMTGTGTKTPLFNPNMPMSRAMLVTVLYRLAGSPNTSGLPNAFTDVPANTWYSNAVAWAAANGITGGMGGACFAPDDNVTREQAATILLRYARLIGKGSDGEVTGGFDFIDKDKISDWALEGAMWCGMIGVITGKQGNNGMLFDPRGNATRAELAAMLHRFVDNIVNNHTDEQPARPAAESSSGSGSDSGSGDFLTVSFETGGGTAIAPVSVPRGGRLPDVSIPLRDDCVFTGWYTDSALTRPFYSDVPITRSMTLYSAYEERDYNYREFVNAVKFLQDCEIDVSFDICSLEPIDDNNADQYISVANKVNIEETPDITVTSRGGNVYTISPSALYTYTPGDTYELCLTNENISFSNEQEEVRIIAFSIIKQEKFDVQFESGIVYLLWSDIQVIDDGVYSLPKTLADDKGIAAGTTVCLTDKLDSNGQGILNENSKIRNVLSLVNTDSTNPRVMLFTEAAGIEDVYAQLDVYVKQSLEADHMISSFDTDKLARDVKYSEGTMRLTKLLAVALNESGTVTDMSLPNAAPFSSSWNMAASSQRVLSASSAGFTDPIEYEDKINLTVKDLFAGLNVTASIGHAADANFHNEADDNKWVVLTLAFNYNGTINNAIQVNANFTFKEYFTFTQGTASGTRTTDKGKQKAVFDLWVDAYSHTKVHFDVLVKTVDIDSEYFDVTAEIGKLIENLTEKDSDNIPKILQNVLGKKGDYIDIAVVDLYEYKKPIVEATPIFQVNLDIDFVVRLNLAVGLSADYNLLSASRIGLRVDKDLSHTETYSYELDGSGKQAFDLYCAGYIGIKAGIRADLSLSIYGLEKLASVGFTGEAGAYIDMYGFLQLHLTVAKKGEKPDINMNGGIYMESGLYVELKIYAKSDLFKSKAEYTVLDKKFPLFSLGDRYVFFKFKNAGKTVLINSNRRALKGSGLTDCEMLDLKTGQVFTQDYAQSENFHLTFSNPRVYIEYDEKNAPLVIPWGETANKNPNTIVVLSPPDGSQRLDAKVQVYYGGGQLCFGSRQKGHVSNEMDLMWIAPGVDPTKIKTLGAVTATYVVNMNGAATTVQTKPMLAGYSPGAFDRYSDYTLYARPTAYTNNWNTGIWQDTVYTVYMTRLQALVDYMYLHDGQWHYEVYAVEAGGTPPLPENYKSPGPGNIFREWLRTDCFSNTDLTNRKTLYVSDIFRADFTGISHTGYDTTNAVYTFTGTKEQCFEKFNANQKTMPVLYHNAAQYDIPLITIIFRYPIMNYTAYGQNFHFVHPEDHYIFFYGDTPLPPKPKDYPGCKILGWSAKSGVSADYDYDKLPPAAEETIYNLVVEFKEASIIFTTQTGTFADGKTTTAASGMIPYPDYLKYAEDFHNANNALTIQPVLKDGVLYKFHHWDVDYSQDKQHIQTWNAVWVAASGQEFTAAFNAGEGAAFPGGSTSLSLRLTYGSSVSLASYAPVKAADNHYAYTLTGWEDQDGNIYGLTDTVAVRKDMTYTALYTPVERIYTVTVSAGNGEFPDGEKTKTFTGAYEQPTNISVDDPVPPAGYAEYHYEFEGWSEDLPDKFTQDMNITAIYKQVYNDYTIAFDAGSGSFEGGAVTVTQTCHYGDEIVPPADPAKAEDEYFRYEFTGWTPPLTAGDTVTSNRTYTANYRSIPKGTSLPESGITVTNGEVTEDVSVGSIPGYTYDMAEAFDGSLVPTLAITGDGLVFSGGSDEACVIITETAENVTFRDLSLSGSYDKSDGALSVPEGDSLLTVNIEGDCVFEKTTNYLSAVRIERSVQFAGIGSGASLQIGAIGAMAIYSTGSLTFDSLSLTINAEAAAGVEEENISAISGDMGGSDRSMCSFVHSDVNITTGGNGLMMPLFDTEIQSSVFNMDCTGAAGLLAGFAVEDSDVTITAGRGLNILDEAAFAGDSQILLAAEDGGAAISAISGISVPEDYDLGGASIQQLTDGTAGDYYTFAIEIGGVWTPESNVKINYP